MKCKWTTYIWLIMFSFNARVWAQQQVVLGVVKDTDGQTLQGAMVFLQGLPPLSAYAKHTQTDSLGRYRFDQLGVGSYLLSVSSLGYGQALSDTIWLKGSEADFVQHFTLERAASELDEVTVTYQAPKLETENGKLIYNLQDAVLNSGQTAFDLLRKMPGVSVDQQDNILLRGSSGLNVLMDGRMTYLSGTQLANYLKGLNAEDISKIELVTAPSSEFDATGNAGIINILMKKNRQQGYAVDLRAGVSKAKYWMHNENISASLRTGTLNMYASFDVNTPHSYWISQSGNTIRNRADTLQLSRANESVYKIYYYTWRTGFDWQFLPKHQVSVAYHGYLDDYTSSNQSTVNRFKAPDILQSFFRSANNIREPYHYGAVHMGYQYDIDSLGKKITADADYTSYRNYSDGLMTTDNFTGAGSFIGEDLLRSHQPGAVQIRSAKADANLPFGRYVLQAGLKYAEVRNDNRYRFDSLAMGDFVEVADLSNHFKYHERVSAAYAAFGKKTDRTDVRIGLRLEHTDADGYTLKQDIANRWKYTQLFPSLSVEQRFGEGHKLDVSVSRRINRPSYTDLNPVRWYTDQYFYYSGNPGLMPELAWVYSTIYSLKTKYIFTASYNYSAHYINRRLVVDEKGAIKSQSANFGSMKRLDISAAIPVGLFPFWSLSFSSDVSYTAYPISQREGERLLSQWAVNGSLQQEFTLPSQFKIALQSYYFSPELRGIYRTQPSFFTDIGLKKELLKDRLSLQVMLSDILNSNRYRGISQTDIADYYYKDKPNTRKFALSLSYHIGGKGQRLENRQTEEQQRL